MSPEKTRHLIKNYPELYRGRTKPITESLMAFGFECGDGWFYLLDHLSAGITDYCKEHNIEVPEVIQVKEKYGTLRYYLGGITKDHFEEIYELVGQVENLSSKTCEDCGKAGKLRGGGWLQTLCDEHSKGRDVYEEPTF